jgi:hypothetical protein
VGDGDDTLDDKGGNVLKFGILQGGIPSGPDNEGVSEDCAESLDLMDVVRDQVASGQVTSLFLFALTSDGSLTRLILSKNRFELAGLALEVEKMIEEESI